MSVETRRAAATMGELIDSPNGRLLIATVNAVQMTAVRDLMIAAFAVGLAEGQRIAGGDPT